MNAKVIGEQIKEYRKKNNVSQRELAEMLFVSDKTVSRWELGKGLPDIELLPKIAEMLGISIDKLVGSENFNGESGDTSAIELYKQELEKLETQLLEKEKESERQSAKRRKIFTAAIIVASSLIVLALLFSIIFKPHHTLTLVGVTTEEGDSTIELAVGERLPKLLCSGKTVLGVVDEDYNFYLISDFEMPDKPVTLRALIKEDMPLFAGSDGDMYGNKVAEHVLAEGNIPATRYTFEAGAKKGAFIQGRPVYDSGEMANINVYAPSLGERFFLLCVINESDFDVNIRYRVENFGDKQGGLDYLTPSATIKANSTSYLPIYFKNNSNYGVFEGCDHFVILDQDVEKPVELTVYGYIYTADELSDIEVSGNLNKLHYNEGELIDLSGIVVKANLVRNGVTGQVAIHNYTCELEGKPWQEGINSVEISFAGKSAEVVINDPFEYEIAFVPAKNLESINDSGGADYIFADYTTADDGTPATRFTIHAGALANMEVEAWINQEIGNTKDEGLNLRIPTFSGINRLVKLIVTNNGGQELSFRYYAENWGDKGGVDISIAPGETKTVEFDVNPGDSLGCNYAFKLLCDVTTETSLTMNGYFYCRSELDAIEIYRSADKTCFAVGESFSSEGLVIKPIGLNYDDVVISNYKTDLDGYIFTDEDVGIKTVTVRFGDFAVNYDIEITR